MLPKVIIHNSISLDGSLTNFEVNMGLHYQIAGNFKPDAHLIGSNTMITGIELYGEGTAPETERDFVKPQRDASLPYWIIIDTKGILKGELHAIRRFEFSRDVVVLISEITPKEYITYLNERNYDHHILGNEQVDLIRALAFISEKYEANTILTDTGQILGNLLFNLGVVNEISLLIHPVIVGSGSYNMFKSIGNGISLNMERSEVLDDGYVWLLYKIENKLNSSISPSFQLKNK